MRFLAAYLMSGRMQAVTAVAVPALLSMLFPPVSLLSSGGVALVTLRKGWLDGAGVILVGAALMGAFGALLFGGFLFAMGYGLLLWLPIWPIAIVLRESGRLEVAIETLVMVGVLGVALVYAVIAEPAALWQARVDQVIEALLAQGAADVDGSALKESIGRIARFMTGIMVCGTVVSVLLGLFLGRWWQALLFNPGGFGKEFLALKPHAWVAWTAVLTIGGALLGGGRFAEMLWNMILPLFVPFIVAGIAVLHTFVRGSRMKPLLLLLLYSTMVLIPHVLLLIGAVGLSDTWVDWRTRASSL